MDCSKTIDFFIETKRLCDSRVTCEAIAHDEQCPLFNFCDQLFTSVCAADAKKAIEILQKWSDEHPGKTYAQDFLEKFPNTRKNDEGVILVCRRTIYGGESCQLELTCANCWNEPMEE